MAKVSFPGEGGTMCLDVVLRQAYQCTDGSSGTTVCSVYGTQYDKCPDVTINSNFYPYSGFSSDLVYIDNEGCLHCDYTNDDDEDVDIGEFCIETTINGKTTEECVEITVEPKGCTYGPIEIALSFPEMSSNGGYSSRVCATYSFSQTKICDGVEEVITSCDDNLCEKWDFTAPYGAGETSIIHENGTVCLVGPENISEDDRVVSTVTLTVTLNGEEASKSFDVIQSGVTGCIYGPVNVELSFPEMVANGGYSSRVCATYSFSQVNVCDGVEETITSCDGGECELWEYDTPYGKEETSLTYEDGTMCLVGPENTSEDDRVVSTVTLTVTLNGVAGKASFDVVQYGVGSCVYEDIDVSDFTYSHTSSAPFSVCGGSISPQSTCYQYKTCNGVHSCNSDLQLTYSWVEQNVGTAELDPETGTVTCNDSNVTNTETRTIGTIRVTATDGTNEKSAETVLIQQAGDGNVYDNPCIEALYGTSVPAEGGSLDLSTCYHYWQNYNCDNPGTVDCVDSGTGSGCQQCPSADPYVNCGSATIMYEVLETYDGAVVSIDENGILTTDHVNDTDERMQIAKVNAIVSWHCVDNELTLEIYQQGIEYTCTYDEPSVSLSYEYSTIPNEGVIDMEPTLSYSQEWRCNDGRSGTITSGADVVYTYESYVGSSFSVTSNGLVYCDTSIGARTVGSVTVTVTLNDASSSATITFAQAGDLFDEWGYPQVTCSYPNIPIEGGYSDINLNIVQYYYGADGSVTDTRGYIIENGNLTYNDYGDDLQEFFIEMPDVFVSGVTFDDDTYRVEKLSANEGASTLHLSNVLVEVMAFNKRSNESVFPVYQNANTTTYDPSMTKASQYTALVGTIVNRSVAEIRVFADRYEDGNAVESDVLICQFGYETSHILNKGDVFYGPYIEGIACGEYHITSLGIRGYNDTPFLLYIPASNELRVNNNYTGSLETPPEITDYLEEISPIYITNEGPNSELDFYIISYNK